MNPPESPFLPAFPAPLARLLRRLPQWPHSAVLAAMLNAAVWPTLDAATRRRLENQPISILVTDAGIDCRVRLSTVGFLPITHWRRPLVCIRASAADFYRLARRLEDPDALFFARRLIIEGDTELGLCLKNALDAVDWMSLPAKLIDKAARFARLAPHEESNAPRRRFHRDG